MPLIDIESPSERFEEHIQIDKNYRIIFSGKFGTGKTYFLNNFFDARNLKHNKFLISPVNYVVSSNEDIFELIKADIIKCLFFDQKIKFEKATKKKLFEKLFLYTGEQPEAVLKFTLSLLAKVNPLFEFAGPFIQSVKEFKELFQEFSKDLETVDQTRHEEIFEYLKEFEVIKGSIYEHNYITKVINTFLKELQENGKKENVLIIDDLDRIDPEHIFRILNILSAHNNQFDSENKFSFDHIIIVCDIENIKKIFFHKYGSKVDFDGYIDKFYSTTIFDFSNKDALKNYVEANFGSQKTGSQESDTQIELVEYVLSCLIEKNFLTIRKLLKHSFEYSLSQFVLYEQNRVQEETFYLQQPLAFLGSGGRVYIESTDLVILRFFKLLSLLFGSLNSFFEMLNELKKNDAQFDYSNSKNVVQFLALQNHICSKIGDELLYSKYRNPNSSQRELLSVGFPVTTFLGKSFQIGLKWSAANPYNSSVSYFKDVVIRERNPTEYQNGKSGEIIKSKDIFQAIENIILESHKRGYLEKAGVHFSG